MCFRSSKAYPAQRSWQILLLIMTLRIFVGLKLLMYVKVWVNSSTMPKRNSVKNIILSGIFLSVTAWFDCATIERKRLMLNVWCTRQRPAVCNDVIAFHDHLMRAFHLYPRIMVIDSAAIYESDAMNNKRLQWDSQELHVYYFPPKSPERSRIKLP